MNNPLKQKNIPKGWEYGSLGDFIVDIKDGGTPSRRKGEYFGGGIPWVVIKDIKSRIYSTNETLSKLGIENSSAKVFPAGTVILSFGATIGEVGIAEVDLATKQGIAGVLPDVSKITTEYLYFLLQSQKKLLNQMATGSTIKEVRPNIIKKINILVPPIKEQKKIADILLSVDEEIQKVEEIISATEKLKKGLMSGLFTKGIGNNKFQKTRIGDILTLEYGKPLKASDRVSGDIPVFGSNGIVGYHDTSLVKGPGVIVGRKGGAGEVMFSEVDFYPIDTAYFVKTDFNKKFIYYLLVNTNLKKRSGGSAVPGLNRNDAYSKIVILPKKEGQEIIVNILSSVDRKIITCQKLKTKLLELKKGLVSDLLSGSKRVKI